ncbi:MAG TPA: YgeY family selenium metabolism-linked hydrolase [Malonomonas sp.]
MLNPAREQQIIELCQQLIRQQSYSGAEEGVVACLQQAFERLGFDDCQVDRYGNIVGEIRGNRPGRSILLDGHIDTVPVPDPAVWEQDPFCGELVEGKIYGRGASDMKGAVAAMACAAGFFAQETGRDFAGSIYVAGVVHEECFEGVAAREISQRYRPDYVVIGEASELNLKIGQRGRAEIVVETFGKPAHSANPQKGINAVYQLARLIERIRQLPASQHPVLGPGILELTDIKSTPYPGASVVPSYCRATYDRRLLVGEGRAAVLAPLQQVIDEMAATDPEFKAKVGFVAGEEQCYTGALIAEERFFPGWLFSAQDDFVQRALAGLQQAGLTPELTYYSFCTNGSHYAGEANIQTLGFGPSRENLAHTIDEHIEVAQLLGAARGYYAIIQALLAD